MSEEGGKGIELLLLKSLVGWEYAAVTVQGKMFRLLTKNQGKTRRSQLPIVKV